VRDGESVDLPQQVVQSRSVGIAVPAGARRDAQPLDDRECLITLEAPDYATERTGQPPNVVVEGEILFSWGSRRWHGVNDTTVSMASAISDRNGKLLLRTTLLPPPA